MIDKNHHYPFKDKQRSFEDTALRFDSVWQEIFPASHLDDLQGRAYKDGERAYESFAASHIAEKDKRLCLRYLNLANNLAKSHYLLLMNPDLPFEFEIDGEVIPVIGKKSLDYTSVTNWSNCFCRAIMLRDNQSIKALSDFIPQNVINQGVEDLPVDYPFAEFLKGIFDGNIDLKATLDEVVKLSAPEYMPERRQSYIYHVWLPFIKIIVAIFSKDETGYQQAIKDALVDNRKHCDNEDRKHLKQGWLPPYIIAAACFAYDHCGYKLPEPSPYIPEWLVYRDFD